MNLACFTWFICRLNEPTNGNGSEQFDNADHYCPINGIGLEQFNIIDLCSSPETVNGNDSEQLDNAADYNIVVLLQ